MNPVPLRLLLIPATALALAACAEVKDTLSNANAGLHDMFGSDRNDNRDNHDGAGNMAHTPVDDTLQAARLMDGDGVARDPKAAVALLRPNAEAGFADAQFLLGLAYNSGQGVERNRATAISWYRRAADQGHAQAQYLLGLAYLNGNGVTRDADEAVDWFRKGAEGGNPGAQYHLALRYADQGQPKEALRWLETAADKGYADAQYLAGEFYHVGRGTARNPAWASRWFAKAAEQGVPKAQYMLGLAYAAPSGVPRNIGTAYFWLDIAARNDEPRAATYRDKVGSLLKPTERNAVAARAAKWRPSSDHATSAKDRASLTFVQYALTRAGYDPGPIDGLLGPRTRRAIAKYRSARGIGTGGQVNEALLKALKEEGTAAS